MRKLALSSLASLLLLAGCGEKQIDGNKVEKIIHDAIAKRSDISKVKSISCPDGRKVKKGDTFDCTLVASDGSKAKLTVLQLDDKGTVKVIKSSPAK